MCSGSPENGVKPFSLKFMNKNIVKQVKHAAPKERGLLFLWEMKYVVMPKTITKG